MSDAAPEVNPPTSATLASTASPEATAKRAPHPWRFYRYGGFDQVRIETVEDLLQLASLDPKLWSVLACPTAGLEFDERTLQMLDTDGDGRIRVPEILAAVQWVCAVLRDPESLFQPGSDLPLAALNRDHPDGARLYAAARDVLGVLGRPQADVLTLADLADPSPLFPAAHFNGDGVIPAELVPPGPAQQVLARALECLGATPDRSGQPGITQAQVDTFFADAQALADWHAKAEADPAGLLPLGADTEAAALVFDAVAAKVDDYFTRCRMAAFDANALQPLSPAEGTYVSLSLESLSAASVQLAALPLALAAPARETGGAEPALPLRHGLNPAWEARMAALRDQVVRPCLGDRDSLTLSEWTDLAGRFAAWRAWQAAKPASPLAGISVQELRDVLASDAQATLTQLIGKDVAADTSAEQVEALDRLLHYRRDLVTLLRNFVTLSDFYGGANKAIFQAGTLYLDQRSCDLVLRVADMARHTALAPLSGTYLVYCQCVRQGEAPLQIVAAMTAGDADDMMVPGRNGIFYDRAGRDWNASVVKVVEAPISVRQAFWTPYKRASRMIGDQIRKFAAAKDKAVDERAAQRITAASAKAEAPVAAAPAAPAAPVAPAADGAKPNTQQAFDIAKFAGIFAAIGLALGALGTALAAVVTGILQLAWWQIPLVFAGVMLLISGPSMLLAWLKLRQRSLGPLLDANGWAVNVRARINIPFGASLTQVARLPEGASRSMNDPFEEKEPPWRNYGILAVVVVVMLIVYVQIIT